MGSKVIAQNPKARHDYQLFDTFEAGLALNGGEVKSIRAGEISIKEAFVKIRGGEAWLWNAYVKPYQPTADTKPEDATRSRKLLLHQREITKLAGAVQGKSQTIVPLKIYLKNGLVKLEMALAKGKKQYDKRQTLKAKEQQREARQAIRAAKG